MARTRRIKSENDAFYHVMSRITGKRFLLKDPKIKRMMISALQSAAEFSGVKLGAYVIMDDHFHLMVEVPTLETALTELAAKLGTVPTSFEGKLPEREVMRRLAFLKSDEQMRQIKGYIDFLKRKGRKEEAEEELDRYRRRMQDLSQFVKTFKEVFNMWYKKAVKYSGSIWGERFKSTLVEDAEYFKKCRDYIEMNPCRAQIVASPEDYAWSTSGAAARGDEYAIKCRAYITNLILAMDGGAGDSPHPNGDSPRDEMMERVPQVGLGKILGGKEFVRKMTNKFEAELYGQKQSPRKIGSWAFTSHGHRRTAA